MSRTCILSLCMAAGLAVAGTVHAVSGTVTGQSSQTTDATAQAGKADASATAGAAATTNAEARAASDQELQTVRQRGAQANADARAKAEAKLNAAAREVDTEVGAKGEAEVAGRLASEFGTTAEAITAEKQAVGVSWGELMVAHTLRSNSKAEISLQQVLGLRTEGLGWGQIAAGLGFNLGPAVAAVQGEAKVAIGRVKVDGKPPVIRGSKLDTTASAKAAASAGPAGVKTSLGANAGAQVPAVKP